LADGANWSQSFAALAFFQNGRYIRAPAVGKKGGLGKACEYYPMEGLGFRMTAIAKIEREFIDVKGAETMTGRSRWSWRRDAYEGKIASVKLGAKLLIPISEIRRVIAENTRPRVA